MDEWASPSAYCIDLLWQAWTIHCVLWFGGMTLNLKMFDFWSGD